MSEPFSERDLRRLRQGDAHVIDRWVRAYADSLYTFVFYRVLKDPDLAAEVVQETFLRALRRIGDYDPQRGSALVWLTYLSKNIIKKALQNGRRQYSFEQVWNEVDACLLRAYKLIATEPLPDEIFEAQETTELVQMTLANIPGNYRKVLVERYYQQMLLKDIASSMGSSEGAVKALLHRAREAFRVTFLRLVGRQNDPETAIEMSNE